MDDLLPAIAIRLADEGVPVRAIARAINIPSADVYDQLDQALFKGRLIGVPRADWPSNGSREERTSELRRMAGIGEQALLSGIVRVFKLTATQGRLLLALLRYGEISNERLHTIYNCRDGRFVENDPAIIKIQICLIRRKLDRFGISVETMWGYGRRMSATDRRQAIKLILEAFEEE
jgi:hypothetical protein